MQIWWYEEFKDKRRLSKAERKWKRGVRKKEEWYIEWKEYKKLIEAREKEQKEISEIRNEQKVWMCVKRRKIKMVQIQYRIKDKECKENFQDLLAEEKKKEKPR